MDNNFYIKEGYHPNTVNLTLDVSGEQTYWDDQRLKTAEVFQHAVYSEALRWAKAKKINRILDVGSGPPVKLEKLKYRIGDEVQIWLIDQPSISSFIGSRWPGYKFIPSDLEFVDINFSEKFDLIICADVIEHLVNPLALLRFMYDTLSPNGRIFLSTPERDLLRGQECLSSPHPMHIREWNFQELQHFLTAAGFIVTDQLFIPPKKMFRGDIFVSKILGILGVRHPIFHSCQLAILGK